MDLSRFEISPRNASVIGLKAVTIPTTNVKNTFNFVGLIMSIDVWSVDRCVRRTMS